MGILRDRVHMNNVNGEGLAKRKDRNSNCRKMGLENGGEKFYDDVEKRGWPIIREDCFNFFLQ